MVTISGELVIKRLKLYWAQDVFAIILGIGFKH
mgnify:CR=1 FL=1